MHANDWARKDTNVATQRDDFQRAMEDEPQTLEDARAMLARLRGGVEQLRSMVRSAAEEREPIPGEYTVLLSAEHDQALVGMWEAGTLMTYPGDDDHGNFELIEERYGELSEAFTTFVEWAIDLHNDMLKMETEGEPDVRIANPARSRARSRKRGG